MTDDMARFAYPVFESGLRVRDMLVAGRDPGFEREHARFQEMLAAPAAGDPAAGPRPGTGTGPTAGFLGVRYVIACWLDEVFITGTAWRDRWNERKLEVELFGTNDRAWKFWDQARLAEQLPGGDPLEVVFLCVQLGFRGVLLEDPGKLRDWASSTRERLRVLPPEESPYDLEPDPAFAAPPRPAARGLDRMLAVFGAVALILIPCVAFLLVSEAGGR